MKRMWGIRTCGPLTPVPRRSISVAAADRCLSPGPYLPRSAGGRGSRCSRPSVRPLPKGPDHPGRRRRPDPDRSQPGMDHHQRFSPLQDRLDSLPRTDHPGSCGAHHGAGNRRICWWRNSGGSPATAAKRFPIRWRGTKSWSMDCCYPISVITPTGTCSLWQGARRAEELGFDSLWVRDHLMFEPHGGIRGAQPGTS